MLPMLYNFPKLSPHNLSLNNTEAFKGFINILGKDYYIEIKSPFFPLAKGLEIEGDIELKLIMQTCNVGNAEINDCLLVDYLKTLQSTAENYIKENSVSHHSEIDVTGSDHHLNLSLLLSHIEELGWENIANVSLDFSSLDLQYRDGKGRKHTLQVKIPAKYPLQIMEVEADLPLEADPTPCSSTLSDLYDWWRERVDGLQAFWDVTDDLDANALVIDPPSPSRKSTTRRIVLKNQVSIHVKVSPDKPFAAPNFHLLGPSSLVAPLNERLLHLYQAWDEGESIIYNLERALKQKVVPRPDGGADEDDDGWSVECAVCYCLRLGDNLPDFACDACAKSFHHQCLYDWLRSLPTSRQTGQFIRGDCPYCTKAVSCNVLV